MEAAEDCYRKGILACESCCHDVSLVLNSIAAVHLMLFRDATDTPGISSAWTRRVRCLESLGITQPECIHDLKAIHSSIVSTVSSGIGANKQTLEFKRGAEAEIQRRSQQRENQRGHENVEASERKPTKSASKKKRDRRKKRNHKREDEGRSSDVPRVGSLTMWNVPAGAPPLEENIMFNTVDFSRFWTIMWSKKTKKNSTEKLSVVDLSIIHIMQNLDYLRGLMMKNKLTIEVHYGVVKAVRGDGTNDLENLQLLKWIDHFMSKGELSAKAAQQLGTLCTSTNCGLQMGDMGLAMPSPLYRLSKTLYMSWCYDPDLRLQADNNPFEVGAGTDIDMLAHVMQQMRTGM
ncbi:hypothetical protein PC128_g19644 [Phytophthora cactorum]|nr:hypothetical protein PC120_g16469 [Phytophthora cactorum]KAG3166734.1 hypothetical protein PC128_g19644 [Phytophthora cactorum]KAG4047660.1 hypothetical protein PC123_g16998 [Phytophthora cactorum]